MTKKEKKHKKSKESGYVPFSREDIKTGDGRNELAESLFLTMLDIPKRAAKKVTQGKQEELEDDDFYPTSLDETMKMESLMGQVDKAIDDRSDSEFLEKVQFMKEVLAWSKKRHWTFLWIIAICVFGVSLYCRYKADDYVGQVKEIKAWTMDQITEKQSADVTFYEGRIADMTNRADTASTKADKKRYLNHAEYYTDMLGQINVSPEEFQKLEMKTPQKHANGWRFWQYFWLVMIGLYVIAERPYGYMISNRRIEAAVLGGIKKLAFALAGGLVGAAGALQFTEVITTYSDGSKSRGDDGMGPAIIALKLLLLVAAAIVVGVTSCAIIVYSVVMGFLRNYELIPMIKKMMAKNREPQVN